MTVLYHASPDKSLTIINPRKTLSKNDYIGDYVFATSNKKLAVMYLATKGNATYMEPQAKQPYIVISSDSNKYLATDRGGAVYSVSANSFEKTPQTGLEDYEMVTKNSVKPIGKEVYKTSVEAMRKYGIEIYFVDWPKFNEIIKAKDKDRILVSIEPYS